MSITDDLPAAVAPLLQQPDPARLRRPFTLLTRDQSDYLTDLYSERKESAAKLEKRVALGAI